MKKIIVKVILFVSIFGVLLAGADLLSMVSPTNQYIAKITNSSTDRIGSAEIEPRLFWVQEQNTSSRLIVGDSVGNQLFIGLRGKNSSYCIATSNQAITMAGQYILISEYVKNHEQVESVYMFIVPQTLGSDIEPRLSYQYMVMPFIKNGLGGYLDNKTEERLKEVFGTVFLQPQIIKAIDYSCVNRKIYLNLINNKSVAANTNKKVSDLTVHYLGKINDLCVKNGVEFYLLPAPVEDTLGSHQQVEVIKKEFDESGLAKTFPMYFDTVHYYSEKEFGDHTHFSGIYTEQSNLNKKIEDIINTDLSLLKLKGIYEECSTNG